MFGSGGTGGSIFGGASTAGGSLFGGGAAASSGGGLFGSAAAASTGAAAGGGLFGSPAAASTGSSLFGAPSTSGATGGGGLFGAGAATSGGGLFGAAPTGVVSTGGGLFGAAAATSGGGLFGAAATGGAPSGGGLFGAAAATSGGGLFGAVSTGGGTSSGGLFGAAPAASGGGLFGAASTGGSATSGGGLFGSSAATSGGGLFGAASTAGGTGGGLFGAAATSSATSGGGLFGAAPAASGGGLFGAASTGGATSGGGLFGAASTGAASTGGGLFGAAAATSGGGLFGAASTGGAATGGSLFGAAAATSGGGLFGAGAVAATSGGSIFGATAATSGGGLFGAAATGGAAAGGGLFGAAATGGASTGGGLFGAAPASSGGASLFGAAATGGTASAGSLFGAAAAATGAAGAFGAASTGGSGIFAATAPPAPTGPPPEKYKPGSVLEQCRRSARFWRGWLERGDSTPTEADSIFTDAALRARLAAPLKHLTEGTGTSVSSTSTATPLPTKATELAQKMVEEVGVNKAVAEDIVRLYAENQLQGFAMLHSLGSLFDMVDLSVAVLPDLVKLLHLEKCESFQILAYVLRSAHNDAHKWSAQCRELAQRLLRDGLQDMLWQTYTEVSLSPKFSANPERAEVIACMNQGLDLQLCVLECLLLARYDPEICPTSSELPCRMAEVFFRQRFLGSLMSAAHSQSWLLADPELCLRAQSVGDLCLALFVEALGLADVEAVDAEGHAPPHPLLSDADTMQHLHRQLSSDWVAVCEHAAGGYNRKPSPSSIHCARMASTGHLAWLALVSMAPPEISQPLHLDRITLSLAADNPRLFADGIDDIVKRRYLLRDAPNREHGVARAVMRTFVGAASSAMRVLRLDPAALGVQAPLSKLMEEVFRDDSEAGLSFWMEDCAYRRDCFSVLHDWMASLPVGLPALLELLGSVSGGRGDSAAVAARRTREFLTAPLRSLLLPYNLVQHVVAVSDSTSANAPRVVFREAVYVEEVILHTIGLTLPEWHLSRCAVLQPGTEAALLDAVKRSASGNTRVHKVRVSLEGYNVPLWRIVLASWDASLAALGWTKAAPNQVSGCEPGAAAAQLRAVLRCVCPLLTACPDLLLDLSRDVPSDERGNGIVARLLASFFACASSKAAFAGPLLPVILQALRACVSMSNIRSEHDDLALPPYASFLQLLETSHHRRFHMQDLAGFVTVLGAALDKERELGAFPTTVAALELIESLTRACPVELFVISWPSHDLVPLLTEGGRRSSPSLLKRRSVERADVSPASAETLGYLLDFTFGQCFARCSYWRCRTSGHRWQLMSLCVQIAKNLLPALECFNWPASAELEALERSAAASNPGSGSQRQLLKVIAAVRQLQLGILRCWSETSFIQILLQIIVCDVAYGAAGTLGAGQFLGFKSIAVEDGANISSAVPEPGDAEPVNIAVPGAQLVPSSLDCLRGLLHLVLKPAGFSSQYAPLLHHLLEVTTKREPLSTAGLGSAAGGSLQAAVPQRADLMQSMYSHIMAKDLAVAKSAASTMTAVCALWSRADLRLPKSQVGGGRQGQGVGAVAGRSWTSLLVAYLSVPAPIKSANATPSMHETSSKPAMLAPELAARLLEVIPDTSKNVDVRCMFLELARAGLAMRPSLLLADEAGGAEVLRKAVTACGQVLLEVIKEAADWDVETEALRSGMLLAAIALLDDLAATDEKVVLHDAFGKPVETYANMWQVLSAVVTKALLPWSSGDPQVELSLENAQKLHMAAATALRLANRGCEACDAIRASSADSEKDMVAFLLKLLGPGMDLCLPWLGDEPKARAKHDEFDLMRHPFGPIELDPMEELNTTSKTCRSLERLQQFRDNATKFHSLLAKYELQTELLAPAGGSAACYSRGPSGLAIAFSGSASSALRDPASGGFPVVGTTPGDAGVAGDALAAEASAGLLPVGEQQTFTARCSMPACFRWWCDLVELACGEAIEKPAMASAPAVAGKASAQPGRMPLRTALFPERLGTFCSSRPADIHSGCTNLDAYIVGAPLRSTHVPSLRLWTLSVACLEAAGSGAGAAAAEDLQGLLGASERLSWSQASMAARVLAVEALDDLLGSAVRLASARGASTSSASVQQVIAPLIVGLSKRLFRVMHQHLELLADHAAFFARLLAVLSHLLVAPPHGEALLHGSEATQVVTCLKNAAAAPQPGKEVAEVKSMLQRETPMGLALVRQLTSALQVCSGRLRMGSALPPSAAALLAGKAFAGGGCSHAEAVSACLSLLLLLVPALKETSDDAASNHTNAFEAPRLLGELLQVLAELFACTEASEERVGVCNALKAQRTTATSSFDQMAMDEDGGNTSGYTLTAPAPGWPAREPVARPSGGASGDRQSAADALLTSPEDALVRIAAETRTRALDHALRTGVNSLILALAERVVHVLRSRAAKGQLPAALGSVAGAALQRHLLPQLLSCNNIVFSPGLDRHRISLGLLALGPRIALTAPLWDRAVETCWATRLDATLSVLLAVSKTPEGALLLAEQRCFALLAYCPLLHAAVLPIDAPAAAAAGGGLGQFPAAYAWPSSSARNAAAAAGAQSSSSSSTGATPWRRPLHNSWCQALLLVASVLSSAPQLASEAVVFLEAYAPRLRYIFRSGLQSGHLAMLEETTAACRILALLSGRCAQAESLLAEAATQAFAFIVNTCVTERSSPSEVFLPVSQLEQLSARPTGRQGNADAEASPAAVPSIFHQRVGYLALDFSKSLLTALLRVSSSPTWLRSAVESVQGAWSAAAPAHAPTGWPQAPSILGFAAGPGGAFPAAAGSPERIWAAVMDIALEAARRVVEILESLAEDRREALLFVTGASTTSANAFGLEGGGSGLWIPLSLAIAPMVPEAAGVAATSSAGLQSPGGLARGLSPPRAPKSPSRTFGASGAAGLLSPTMGPKQTSSTAGRGATTGGARCFKHMALRPEAAASGQATRGCTPEYTSIEDLRGLCSSVLEMICTLLCHFCQTTGSSITAQTGAGALGGPGAMANGASTTAASVLHGLLSFLHELQTSPKLKALGIDQTMDYLGLLDNALRSSQNLGMMAPEHEHAREKDGDWIDGEAWVPSRLD
eukprot:TRINITY_DN11045_c0_g1_i1.p1 TRINITY_DN11045_c0_g1~~TRINITY_DN11045_c0_g1_i1.p1  ORF type:complete len:3077 (+),score=722.35 TRINITY_DN11045_c0_g1_i1:129-9359(+)